jgi:hypothetical protein
LELVWRTFSGLVRSLAKNTVYLSLVFLVKPYEGLLFETLPIWGLILNEFIFAIVGEINNINRRKQDLISRKKLNESSAIHATPKRVFEKSKNF